MHGSGKMLRSFQFALDESLVDDHLRRDIGEFTFLPLLYLLAHGLEVPLHPVDAHRDAIDQRERLRVFCEHWRKHAWENVSKDPQDLYVRNLQLEQVRTAIQQLPVEFRIVPVP